MNAAFPTVHGTHGPLAVIDTSFWSLACITGLEPYLWKEWSIIAAPDIIQKELFHTVTGAVQQQRFHQALATGHLVIHNPQTLISTLSKGEQAAVSLALELHVPVLLDDYRAYQHAYQQYQAQAIAVAQCLVFFLIRGILNLGEAETIFLALKQTGATHAIFLKNAAQQISIQGGRVLWP